MSEIIVRKQPRQARSRATCAAIRQAAARVLVQGGAGALNTNAVAEVAGVSVGTLYQYYPSKEAILAEMVREMRGAMLADLERARDAAEGRDLRATVQLLVAASLDHHRRDPAGAEALERAEAALPMDGETAALKARIGALVVGVLLRHGIGAPHQAAQDLSAMTQGMAQAAVAAGETDFDALAGRISRAAIGYLEGGCN